MPNHTHSKGDDNTEWPLGQLSIQTQMMVPTALKSKQSKFQSNTTANRAPPLTRRRQQFQRYLFMANLIASSHSRPNVQLSKDTRKCRLSI